MRIRLPFAGAFVTLSLLAAYLGLSSHPSSSIPEDDPSTPPPSSGIPTSPSLPINDKALHFATFFLLTIAFYWILDTSRRRVLNLTLLSITLGLGIGSEFLQEFIPNGRKFDLYDIVYNVVGSLLALAGCSWYHMRMLERKRVRRGYGLVAGGLEGDDVDGLDGDLELGTAGAQEEGVVPITTASTGIGAASLEDEVDNWDENIEDAWDVDGDEHTDNDTGLKTPSASSAGEGEGEVTKKRSD